MCVEYDNRLGAYDGYHLKPAVEESRLLRQQFRAAVLADLMDNPPFEVVWLGKLSGTARNLVMRSIIDPSGHRVV